MKRGGRISSPELRHSLAHSENFTGLEQDVNRYDLLLLVKRIGKGAGFSAKMIHLLDYYMAFTRDIDWEQGSAPIIYQSLSKAALDLGVSERQIQRLEQSLFDAGALTWNDSGNHRRFGQRCEQSGMILFAYGVDLTPLAYLKQDLEAKLQEKKRHDSVWMETKRQISWYRRQIKACLLELSEVEDLDPPIYEIEAAYDEIAVQIRTTIKLDRLNRLRDEHQELYNHVLSLLETNNLTLDDNVPSKSLGAVYTDKETNKESSKSAKNVAYYKYTNKQPSNKLDTSKAVAQNLQGGSKRCLEDKTERVEPGERPKGRVKSQNSQPKEAQAQPESLILETGLQHITLKQALNASSERFRENMPIDPRPMNWNDFIEASYKLKADLHISQQAWANACTILGRTGASICVLLTDHATKRADDPVLKPAGYFNAMINRAKTGELKLHNSIFGILKREGESEG
jgi:hypothetical protein